MKHGLSAWFGSRSLLQSVTRPTRRDCSRGLSERKLIVFRPFWHGGFPLDLNALCLLIDLAKWRHPVEPTGPNFARPSTIMCPLDLIHLSVTFLVDCRHFCACVWFSFLFFFFFFSFSCVWFSLLSFFFF